MSEIVKCKVQDITSGRWEIRLQRRVLPDLIKTLAYNPIKLKFDRDAYTARTGISSKGKSSQYFWINTNTREDKVDPIKVILENHGYKLNDEIVLSIDGVKCIAYVHPLLVYEALERLRRRSNSLMTAQLRLNDPNTSKLHNIIDMGLEFSAMIRIFEKGSKEKLRDRVRSEIHSVFEAQSEKQFNEIHTNFCNWGTQNIIRTERKKDERVVKKAGPASYGQIAKTLNVVLKVVIYYCHLPNYKKSDSISKWLHAAVDNKMMALLKRYYPNDIRPWPVTIEQVNNLTYMAIQKFAKRFIHEIHGDKITPVQFDDIYWEALNRPSTRGS